MSITHVYEDSCASCRCLGTRIEVSKVGDTWQSSVVCRFCGHTKILY